MGDTRDRPVITGLVALVGVAVVVGLLAGLAAIVGTRIIGLGGDSDSSAGEPRDQQSLYLPDPVRTEEEGGPLVTLAGTPTQQAEERSPPTSPPWRSRRRRSTSRPARPRSSGEEQLYLSGTYPGGEGSILDIEYKINDQPWREFNLDVNVSGQSFATYVYTSNVGTIKWRMWDKSRNKRSNEVTVKHG